MLFRSTSTTMAIGTVEIEVEIKGLPESKSWQEFFVIRNCPKIILLGIPFCSTYHSIQLPFHGSLPALNIIPKHSRGRREGKYLLGAAIKAEAPILFRNLTRPNEPIKQASKRFSLDEKSFIKKEVAQLLKKGIIRKSHSSWRSQIEVTKNPLSWKLRVNYAQTVNKRFQDGVVEMKGIDQTLDRKSVV